MRSACSGEMLHFRLDSLNCNYLRWGHPPSTQIGAILPKTPSRQSGNGLRQHEPPRKLPALDLFRFAPFRLNRLAAEVSAALASEYRERYGLDIPEWRVLATLGFRREPCSAQYVAACTRTHKSTISRAVTSLLERRLIERVENANDRREFRLRLTRKGKTLYEELIPRLQQRERDIMACLSTEERKTF